MKPWRESQDIFEKEAYTQKLGRRIFESDKFEGIRYPSAKVNGEYNNVIFPDRLKRKSRINIYDPEDILTKIQIN